MRSWKKLPRAGAAVAAGAWSLTLAFGVSAQEDRGVGDQVEEDAARGRAAAGPASDTQSVSGGIRPDEVERAASDEDPTSDRATPEEILDVLSRLKLDITSTHEIHTYENRDFMKLDESSDLAIINTDDRTTFGHSDVNVGLSFEPKDDFFFYTRLKYDVLWRDDQLGRVEGSTGDLNFFELYFKWIALNTKEIEASMSVGRQAFTIGGVPRDYMLQGTADAVVLTADARMARLRLMGDLFAGNDLPVNGYQFYGEGRDAVFGLRGETNTFRVGGILEMDDDSTLVEGLMAKAYYFYASIGGGAIEETGADITYGGLLGNFRDADYQHLMGLRAGYTLELGENMEAMLYGELARSEGIDRKPAVAFDVDTGGNAFGGGGHFQIEPNSDLAFKVAADFYSFDGPTYSKNGLEFERGFVGFRGAWVGGLNMGRYLGWRPSAHLDAFGVNHTPQDRSRASGLSFLHAGLEAKVAMATLNLDWWMYTDTGSTNVTDFDNIPDPPFGYSAEEFRAQERLGKDLGQEFDVKLTVELVEDTLNIYGEGGIFLPGDYYAIEVERVAGVQETALGGQETFLSFRGGAMVTF